jgi:hypothetical protein
MTHDALLREIELTRSSVRRDYVSLRNELDYASKARRAIASKPAQWLGAAATLGFLLSGRRRKKKIVVTKAQDGREIKKKQLGVLGFLLGLIRIALPLAKPFLAAFATRRCADLATRLSSK